MTRGAGAGAGNQARIATAGRKSHAAAASFLLGPEPNS